MVPPSLAQIRSHLRAHLYDQHGPNNNDRVSQRHNAVFAVAYEQIVCTARLVSVVHQESPNPYPVVSRLRDRNSAASGAGISMDQVCHGLFLNLTRTFSRVPLQ